MIIVVIGLSLAVGTFCMFIIKGWKPAALGYGNIVYFVMRHTWLCFVSYCYFVNKNHTTSGPGPSPHFPRRDITQPSGGK